MPNIHILTLLAARLAIFTSIAHALTITYCSPDNTGADDGYAAGEENPSSYKVPVLMQFVQPILSFNQMVCVNRHVKIPMHTLFCRVRIAGAQIMLRQTRNPQTIATHHVLATALIGVVLPRVACTDTTLLPSHLLGRLVDLHLPHQPRKVPRRLVLPLVFIDPTPLLNSWVPRPLPLALRARH